MDTNEIKNIDEKKREFETDRRYRELSSADEFKKTREMPVKEHAQTPTKRRPKQVKSRVSLFAAATLTTIVTVATVVSLALNVKLVSFTADYTSIAIVLDIENGQDETLSAQLSVGGDTIDEAEISAGKGVNLLYENLRMGTEYLLQIVSADGKAIYSQTFETKSPVTFYENPQNANRLYFTIDNVFVGYDDVFATLTREDGLDLSAINRTAEGEFYIDKSVLFAGVYRFELAGFLGSSSGDSHYLFGKEMEFDGPASPVFEFETTSEGIRFYLIDGQLGLYEVRSVALSREGSYETSEVFGDIEQGYLIPANKLTDGVYTLDIIGNRQSDGGIVESVKIFEGWIEYNASAYAA